jgi:O-antigen/teichoic acid export membrane protein
MGPAKNWARRLWEPGGTLSQRVVHGGFWVFALRISDRLFKFTRTIILARVLAPSDFGLLGIALLAMSTLETFSQTGFQAALIQKKEDAEDYLDTAWTVSALRGIVLFAILCLAAPYVASFFHNPAGAPIIRAIGVSVLLRGLSNIGVVYFQKELEFEKQFVYQLSGTIADLIVAITAALILRNVWALVLGLLAGNLVRLVMSYWIHDYKPRLRFERGRVSSLFSYGKWMLLSGILILVGARGDDAVVGRVLGASALGLYQMAYRISQLAVTEITYVVGQTAFPAYSKLQDELEDLQRGYYRVASFSATLSMPTAMAIAMLGSDFTGLFLGEQWLPMAPVLALLAAAALVKSIVTTGSPLFLGSGNPQSEFQMQLARGLTVAVLIFPLTTTWGMSGAAVTVVVSGLSMLTVWYTKIGDQLQLAPTDLAGVFGPPFVSSVAMAGAIHLFRFLSRPLFPATPPMQIAWFLLAVVFAFGIYSTAIYLCQRVFPKLQVLQEVAQVIRR